MKVKEYYNKEAENYVDKFTKGSILGRLRRKEIDDVLTLLQPRKGEEILDAGCGAGVYALKLREAGAVPYGVDISPKMIEKLKSYGIDGCVGDIADIDLGRKFKKIICIGVLEFCKDPRTVIRNLVNHLEDGGRLVILYPRMGIGGGLLYKLYHMLFSGLSIKLYDRRYIESMNSLRIDAYKENFISDVIRVKKFPNMQKPGWYFDAYFKGKGILHTFHKRRIDATYDLIPTNKEILDVGCGSGILLYLLSDVSKSVHGVDIREDCVEYCRKKIPDGVFTVGDARNFNLEQI